MLCLCCPLAPRLETCESSIASFRIPRAVRCDSSALRFGAWHRFRHIACDSACSLDSQALSAIALSIVNTLVALVLHVFEYNFPYRLCRAQSGCIGSRPECTTGGGQTRHSTRSLLQPFCSRFALQYRSRQLSPVFGSSQVEDLIEFVGIHRNP